MTRFYFSIACLLFLCNVVLAKNKPVVQNALLDLRTWNWQQDGTVNLTGTWEFCWKKFYEPSFFQSPGNVEKSYAFVPSLNSEWGFGYATYHLKVLCPAVNERLAVKFLTVSSAYRLFINGKEVLNTGKAGTTAETTVPLLKPAVINVDPENNELDIVIQVSNFSSRVGGLWDFITLGTEDQVYSHIIKNVSLEFFVAGSFFLAGIYYLILFFNFRRTYTLIFFSLLCFVIFIRSLVTSEMPLLYIANVSWQVVRRLEFISLYLSVPVMVLFSYYLFPQDFSKKAVYIILSLCSVFVLLSFFASYYIYTYPLQWYQAIMLLSALYGLFVYIKAAINKRAGSGLFLAGFCIFIVTIINDILYTNLIIDSVPLFYVGLFFFIITLKVLLSKQFGNTFSDLTVANDKLLYANKKLDSNIIEINQKNLELEKIGNEMDAFVSRTSHDLRAPLMSLLGIINVANKEQNVANIQEYFAMQEKSISRMDSLIKDIMDYSKNKRLELDLKEIDFSELVNHSLEDHAFISNAQVIKKNVEIIQNEKFVSDPRRLRTIINNLVSNSIKYADFKKENPEINIRIMVADNMSTIEVTDNGIGIEEKHLDKIFTLFYRATNSSTGSGLGLYIIKETVEMLQGNIVIQSKKHEGTKIRIRIPDISNDDE